MAEAHAKHHDYHLVEPSPWPAFGATAAFIMAVGAISWMHHSFPAAPYVFGAGVIGVLYTMFAWWRDVVREADREGHPTRVVQISHRYGMILFIASEVMFFVAWFWAYFDVALFPTDVHQVMRDEYIGGVWPPKGIQTFDPWHLPFLNTLILLTSGTTVTWAHHALLHDDRKNLKLGLILTIALGLSFTAIQASSMRSSIWASNSPPGTGTSSTWCGCSCSPASMSGARALHPRPDTESGGGARSDDRERRTT